MAQIIGESHITPLKCSMRYFCFGALLIFAGAVFLCALGFTVALPHERTRAWPQVTCNVTWSGYNRQACGCGYNPLDKPDCKRRYPCVRVQVSYRNNSGDLVVNSTLYRNWKDAFYAEVWAM